MNIRAHARKNNGWITEMKKWNNGIKEEAEKTCIPWEGIREKTMERGERFKIN